MDAYKVVLRNPAGNLISCWVSEPKAKRVYEEGVPVVPEEGCGPLSAFATYGEAQQFLVWLRRLLYTPPRQYLMYKCRVVLSDLSDLIEEGLALWHTYASPNGKYGVGAWDLPQGTVLCSEITLLEKVA